MGQVKFYLDVSFSFFRLQQIRENKKSEVLAAKRAMGGVNFPPILTGVVCIDGQNESERIRNVINVLTSCDSDLETSVCEKTGIVHVAFPKFKKRFSFMTLDSRDLVKYL